MRRILQPLGGQKGATLVESLVAIALAGIIITAIVGLVVSAVSTSTLSKARTTASRYAEEGIEVARKTRDRTVWNSFWTTYVAPANVCKSPNNACYIDSSVNMVTSGTGLSITPFTRKIFIENAETASGLMDRAKVTISVTWIDRGKSQEVKLVTYLTTWRK